jgi:hypothetical protein
VSFHICEELVLENEENEWIVVAKHKQKKQTKKLVDAEQEVKLKQPPYKLKPPPSTLQRQMKDKCMWEKKPMNTCTCCGTKGHISRYCYTRMREDKMKWRKLPHPIPGEKPLNWKERLRLARL